MKFSVLKFSQMVTSVLWTAAVVLLGGCFSAPALPTSTPSAERREPVIQEYLTHTPTATRSIPQQTTTPTPRLAPTATPFVYLVKAEDTLLEIAWRFGITLQSLKDANPAVNPNIMSVGQKLVIPLPTPGGSVTPTQQPEISLASPVCFAAGDSGIWCLVGMMNESDQIMANVQIQLTVPLNPESITPSSQAAALLVDRLMPGMSLPAIFYFDPPSDASLNNSAWIDQSTISAEIVSAQPGSEEDPRYVKAEIIHSVINISADGMRARLTGQAQVTAPYARMWIVAAAYTATGQPVALRRWDFDQHCVMTNDGCAPVDFDVQIFSLGPALDRVDLFVEALK